MNDPSGIEVFSPATISNLGSGFDIIGFPLEKVGDTLKVEKNDDFEVKIANIIGYTDIPKEPEKNVASFAVMKMLDKLNSNQGFDITIHKEVRPGSGIGSSASSSTAAVFAVNELLGRPFNSYELIELAMEGEGMASGGKHADNVAPAILGGITVVRSYNPFEVIRIEPPEELWSVLIHPQMEIKTELSRRILPENIKLSDAIKQWGNVAGLIAGFYTANYQLIGSSMEDYIIEPVRSELIPGYSGIKTAALQNGALGCTISGSGPSVFALCKGEQKALEVKEAMSDAYKDENIAYLMYHSKIGPQGTQVLKSW
jgi:homoserine kinase